MSFSSGVDTDLEKIGSGELMGENHIILTGLKFEDGLKIGRFAKLDTDSIDNMDGSDNPVIAGVVKRSLGNNISDLDTYSAANNVQITYIRSGLLTVDVKESETPALFDRVYVSNDGLATTDDTDLAVNGYFIRVVDTDIWLIELNMSSLAQDLIADEGKIIVDGGDASAINVTESGNLAVTSLASETRTLADPEKIGTELTITLDVDGGGSVVITAASVVNQNNHKTITLIDAGDIVVLKSVQIAGALIWRVTASDGPAFST